MCGLWMLDIQSFLNTPHPYHVPIPFQQSIPTFSFKIASTYTYNITHSFVTHIPSHNSRFRSLTSSTLQFHNSFYTHQMWWDKSTYVSITCWQADAKKRKLRQTLGMSTFVASQTGLPWSRDSASANSSRHASTLSAIVLRYLARSAGDVLLQLQKCE